jgi:hypothetical protein
MKANVGKVDKYFRLILGGAILGVGLVNLSWWGLLGAIPILTALMKWCPLYYFLNAGTSKKIE